MRYVSEDKRRRSSGDGDSAICGGSSRVANAASGRLMSVFVLIADDSYTVFRSMSTLSFAGLSGE